VVNEGRDERAAASQLMRPPDSPLARGTQPLLHVLLPQFQLPLILKSADSVLPACLQTPQLRRTAQEGLLETGVEPW